MQNCRIGGNFHKKTQREKKREIAREQEVIDNALDSIILEFQYILFYKDVSDTNVFEEYNSAWIAYSERWNKDNRKVLKCDPERFYNYAIKQD